MTDDTLTTDRVTRISPWPLFVAVGLALSEVGVLLGIVPLAVGGILLFGGSCAGVVHESGYASSPWRPVQAVGGLFFVIGLGVWLARLPAYTVRAAVHVVSVDLVALRGAAILGAGGLLVLGGLVGSAWRADRGDMFG
ncbi:MAG: cox cluster protein [Haloferacaceae archaeon]